MRILYSIFVFCLAGSIVSWKNKPAPEANEYTVITLWSASDPINSADKQMLHQLETKYSSTIKYFEHEWTTADDIESFLKQNNIDLSLVSADNGLKFKRINKDATVATSSKSVTIILKKGSTYLFTGTKLNEAKLKEALGIWKFS